jgi:hypothetical protein
MKNLALAELLLRRKELQQKVDRLRPLNEKDLYEVKINRKQINETVDELAMKVPRIKASDGMAMYDHYAKRLRLVDAAIQRANWETQVPVDESLMDDYISPDTDK